MATNGPSTVDRGDRAYEFRMFGTKKALCFGWSAQPSIVSATTCRKPPRAPEELRLLVTFDRRRMSYEVGDADQHI
jgi:hypothetical protein